MAFRVRIIVRIIKGCQDKILGILLITNQKNKELRCRGHRNQHKTGKKKNRCEKKDDNLSQDFGAGGVGGAPRPPVPCTGQMASARRLRSEPGLLWSQRQEPWPRVPARGSRDLLHQEAWGGRDGEMDG